MYSAQEVWLEPGDTIEVRPTQSGFTTIAVTDGKSAGESLRVRGGLEQMQVLHALLGAAIQQAGSPVIPLQPKARAAPRLVAPADGDAA